MCQHCCAVVLTHATFLPFHMSTVRVSRKPSALHLTPYVPTHPIEVQGLSTYCHYVNGVWSRNQTYAKKVRQVPRDHQDVYITVYTLHCVCTLHCVLVCSVVTGVPAPLAEYTQNCTISHCSERLIVLATTLALLYITVSYLCQTLLRCRWLGTCTSTCTSSALVPVPPKAAPIEPVSASVSAMCLPYVCHVSAMCLSVSVCVCALL